MVEDEFNEYSMSVRPDHISVPEWQFMLMEELDANMEKAYKYRVMFTFDKILFFHTDFIETIGMTWDKPEIWDIYLYSLVKTLDLTNPLLFQALSLYLLFL